MTKYNNNNNNNNNNYIFITNFYYCHVRLLQMILQGWDKLNANDQRLEEIWKHIYPL